MAQSDMGAVRAGMEILRWRYEPGFWSRYVLEDQPAQQRNLKRDMLVGWLGIVGIPAAFCASTLALEALPWFYLGVFYTGGGIIAMTYLTISRGLARKAWLSEFKAPSVVFTSSGVQYGDEARLWRHDDYRLSSIELRAGRPARLVLDFEGHSSGAPLVIPVPPEVRDDAAGMVETLKWKTRRAQQDVPPLDPELPRPPST